MALLINRSRPNKTAKNGNTGLNFVNDGLLTHYPNPLDCSVLSIQHIDLIEKSL
jgi:hypothetical protein